MQNVAEFTEFVLFTVRAVITVVHFCLQLPKAFCELTRKQFNTNTVHYNTRLVRQTFNFSAQLNPQKVQSPAEEPTCSITDKPDLKQKKKKKSYFCKNLHPLELLTSNNSEIRGKKYFHRPIYDKLCSLRK